MKKPKKMLAFAMIACLVSSVSAGCAKNGMPAWQSLSTSAKDYSSAQEKRVYLTYAGWGTANEKNVTQKAIDTFNAMSKSIKVSYMHIPTDYSAKMATLAAANQLPDVFMFFKEISAKWGEDKNLYNLKEFLDKDKDIDESKLIPNALLKVSDDKVIGIKICEEVFANYYNVDMFREAGVEMPPATADNAWDWDKFVEISKKMTMDEDGNNARSPDFDPNRIKQYGVRFNRWMWSLFFDSNQAGIVTPDKSKLNLTDPAITESIQKLADLINVHHVAPTLTEEKDIPNPSVALQSRRIAMDLDGQWINVDLGTAGMNFDVGVLPKMKVPSTVQFGEMIVMSGQVKYKEEAWVLLKWMINPEVNADIYKSGLWMPIVKEWYTDPQLLARWVTVKPGHSRGFKTAVVDVLLEHGSNNHGYWLKNSEEINAAVTTALDDVWLGLKSAHDAFEELEPQLAAKYKGVYD